MEEEKERWLHFCCSLVGCPRGTGEVSKGPCPNPKGCVCTKRQQPVCGVDSITYDNRCQLDCAWVYLSYCCVSFVPTPSLVDLVTDCCVWYTSRVKLCTSTPPVLTVVRSIPPVFSWYTHRVVREYTPSVSIVVRGSRGNYCCPCWTWVQFPCWMWFAGILPVSNVVRKYTFSVDCRS